MYSYSHHQHCKACVVTADTQHTISWSCCILFNSLSVSSLRRCNSHRCMLSVSYFSCLSVNAGPCSSLIILFRTRTVQLLNQNLRMNFCRHCYFQFMTACTKLHKLFKLKKKKSLLTMSIFGFINRFSFFIGWIYNFNFFD